MVDIADTDTGPKALKAKSVKRRMGRILNEEDTKLARKKKSKLARAIIRQIASGDIKNPRAVARAFVNAQSEE